MGLGVSAAHSGDSRQASIADVQETKRRSKPAIGWVVIIGRGGGHKQGEETIRSNHKSILWNDNAHQAEESARVGS